MTSVHQSTATCGQAAANTHSQIPHCRTTLSSLHRNLIHLCFALTSYSSSMSRLVSLVSLLAVLLILSTAVKSAYATSSSSSSTVVPPTASLTFCQNYSGSVSNATLQIDLLTLIVTRAAVGGSYSVDGTDYFIPGLFNSSGPLYALFTGEVQYRVGAPNYITNTTALGVLAGKLVSYFGALFGCTAPGFPAVTSTYDMYAVHANMSIDYAQESYFDTQLALTLLSLGVPAAVVDAVAAPALGLFNRCGAPIAALDSSARVQICGTPDCPLATGATTATCAEYYPTQSASSSSSSAVPPPGPASLTFCQNYSGSVSNATLQIDLLTLIVTRAAVGGSYSVDGTDYFIPGLFNSSGPLYALFTGEVQYRVGAPNYITNTTALGVLAGKLVSYFGALFGCTAPGFPAVTSTYDMYAVHANMSIDYAQESYFDTQLALTLLSLGVPAAVVDAVAAPALGLFNRCGAPIAALDSSARVQICGTPDCPLATGATTATCAEYYPTQSASSSSSSAVPPPGPASLTFCQNYSGSVSNATLQIDLLTLIVTRAAVGGSYSVDGTDYFIPGLFNSSGPLYALFTGEVQYRVGAPNYITNTTALGVLAGKLVSYFGALFGCTAPGFPAVTSTYDMYAVHANMSIDYAQESYFDTQLALTLLSLGVPAAVVDAVAAPALGLFNRCGAPIAALDSSARVQICGTPDCPLATGATTATCAEYYPTQSASSSSSSAVPPPGPASLTFCQNYSGSVSNATLQIDLLTLIVTRAAVGGSYSVDGTDYFIPGLFNSSGPLYALFTGEVQYRVGAPNYITNTTALGVLAGKLVSYFGALFGCTAPGFPAVTSTYDMYAVHANMSIDYAQESYFDTQLALTLLSLGVPAAVVDAVAAPALGLFNRCGAPIAALDSSARVQICGTPDCPLATGATTATCAEYYPTQSASSSSSSAVPPPGPASLTFCQNYSGSVSNATLQIDLLTLIVTRAAVGGSYSVDGTDYFIPGLFNSSGPLYALFTGEVQYRVGAPNYITNTTALGVLAGKLVSYFGALFGCTAPGFPAVTSTYDMYAVHANMSIDYAQESYFDTQLALTLLSLGVPAAVVDAVAAPALGLFNRCGAPIAALDSSARVQICGTPDCPLATGATTATCAEYYPTQSASSSSSSAVPPPGFDSSSSPSTASPSSASSASSSPTPISFQTSSSSLVSSSTALGTISGATSRYANKVVFVALAAVAASMLL